MSLKSTHARFKGVDDDLRWYAVHGISTTTRWAGQLYLGLCDGLAEIDELVSVLREVRDSIAADSPDLWAKIDAVLEKHDGGDK
jgi:hypothetical protein